MPAQERYDPLDKRNLAFSLAVTFIEQPAAQMQPEYRIPRMNGVGVYALYYRGNFPFYQPLSERNRRQLVAPIYVGKAMPEGVRKGGLLATTEQHERGKISGRLGNHYRKIDRQAVNLNVEDFWYRWLPVQAVWIPFCESLLISALQPIWNVVIDGFGSNAQGGNRDSDASAWEWLHAHRRKIDSELKAEIDDHLNRLVPTSFKRVREFIFRSFAETGTETGGAIPNPPDTTPAERDDD